MALSLEQLLSPIADNPPCGENKFDDVGYGGLLDQDLQDIFGDDDRGTQEGERKEKEDGDWPSFLGKVISFFGYTKHLTLGYYASLADLNLSGLSGLADGLTLVRQLLSRYWDDVYPLLDDGGVDERNDSLLLFNSADMLKSLSALTVARGRQAGSFTLKEAMSSKSSGVPAESLVEAAISETMSDNPDFYVKMGEDLEAVRNALSGLKSDLEEADADFDCSFAALEERLGYIESFLSGARSGGGGNESEGDGAGEEASGSGTSSEGIIRVSGEINSRADVVKSLDRIIQYYTRSEPASPVPQLLVRVKRLVDMNFTEIIDEFSLDSQTFNADSIFGSVKKEE